MRKLTGFWRWLLVAMTAVTIALCINQQFNLRFFVGFTQLNTEYYYLLILCMLPFTFLIFPGSVRAPADRIPWYDVALFLATGAASIYLMFNVRKAAELGWEFGGAPALVNAAGLVMWAVLMEGAAPHGWLEPAACACCPSRSIRCLPSCDGSGRSGAISRPSIRRSPITCSPPRACSASPFKRSPRPSSASSCSAPR